jgi:hypothetical protein
VHNRLQRAPKILVRESARVDAGRAMSGGDPQPRLKAAGRRPTAATDQPDGAQREHSKHCETRGSAGQHLAVSTETAADLET